MLDKIRELNEKGIKWEFVFIPEKQQLYIKYGNTLEPWYGFTTDYRF